MNDQSHSNSPQSKQERIAHYFDFLADMGMTKHTGSLNSTLELIRLCDIGPGQYVLDVGCGVGITPCLLAEQYGCRVVGVDITPKMIAQSEERARSKGVGDTVEFRVADTLSLPFEDATFDAVLTESVFVFLDDPLAAMREQRRVTKPGGIVGINETTLLKPPPPDYGEYVARTTGIENEVPSAEVWEKLLRNAGLRDVISSVHQVSIKDEARGRLKRFTMRDMLGAVWRLFRMYVRNPESRDYIRYVGGGAKYAAGGFIEYYGYGIYAGRK